MKIEIANPPLFDEILKVFPKAAGPGVIFAWGDTIFNPSGIEIPPALLAHEEVHGHRQRNLSYDSVSSNVEEWWQKYLADPEFRYNEELHAHAAELNSLKRSVKDRNQRARLMQATAVRLLAPLYSYGVPKSLNQAIADLRFVVERK